MMVIALALLATFALAVVAALAWSCFFDPDERQVGPMELRTVPVRVQQPRRRRR